MGKFPKLSLEMKRKRGANAQKRRFPCVKSETAACLGDEIGQKKQGPQIERNGLFFGLCNGHHKPTDRRMGTQKSPVRPKPNGATPPTESAEESAEGRSQQAAESHAKEKRRGHEITLFHRRAFSIALRTSLQVTSPEGSKVPNFDE